MTTIRWTVAGLAAVLLATATGLVAAYFRPQDEQLLSLLAFGLCTLPAWFGLMYIALSPDEDAPHREDTVESQWVLRASSGAFFDVFIALGVTTAITSIVDLAPIDPGIFLLLAMADLALRLALLRRREG
ncbi:MAG: hypothetical protein WCF36_07220 [Candidatus Nanopelagicales bacterium]